MSKPELVHEREVYGFTLRHSHANDYAVLVDAAGTEQEFAENLGMIAQGAPSATLLAITAAKRGQADNDALRKMLKSPPVVVDSPLPMEDEPDTDVLLESEGE